jgi:putative ABC transport system permease protein
VSDDAHDYTLLRAARMLVAVAARLIPAGRRESWREEWESELWHQVNGRGGGGGGRRAATAFLRSFGAFPHAVWILGEEWNMDSLMQDVRFAFRTLTKRPAFAVVAITTLALGIGGTTAVFSAVHSVLLRPLPVENGDRLVFVWGREFNGAPSAALSPPDFKVYAEEVQAFEHFAAYAAFANQAVYRGGDRPAEWTARGVTHDLLDALGEVPAAGRGFSVEDTRGARPEVMMLSHGLWGRMFGFGADVVGSTIVVGADQYTVVGVLPEGLKTPFDADVWVPLTFGAEGYEARAAHFLFAIGLLREGVEIAEAQSEMDAVAARLEAAYPDTNEDWYPILQDLKDVLVGSTGPALLVILASIVLVLLVACANVASLLMARSLGRRSEVAVRAAMGAPSGRLVRQLLTESLMLAFAGGTLGVIVAWMGVDALVALQPTDAPGLGEVAVDGSVLMFALTLSTIVGVLFGMAPALGLARGDVAAGLRSGGRSRVGGSGRLRSVLVGGEVAVSFVLLVGGALLVRSFSELTSIDPGFEPDGLIATAISLREIEDDDAVVAATDAILERVRAVPGVLSAGAATILPFSGLGGDTYVYAEGRPPAQTLNIQNTALVRTVDEGYFETMGIEFEVGRPFDRTDDRGAVPKVIINQALSDRLWQGEDPLGQRLMVELGPATALEVVGVVEDVRQFAMGTPAMAEFFVSNRQSVARGYQIVARIGPAGPSVDVLQQAIWDVAPEQTLSRVTHVASMVQGTMAPVRLQAMLLGAFSALAVTLAGLGIYGVLAEGVSGRRREIGVRMAMGAQPSSVVGDVVAQGVRVAAIGLAVGAVAALFAMRLLASTTLLFGVGPNDPATFLLTPLFLMVVVLVSSWIPARQAARIDPVAALRAEM